jgi:hypothetical protein
MVINKSEIAPGIVVYKDVLGQDESFISDVEDAVSLGSVMWRQGSVKTNDDTGVYLDQRDTLAIGIPYTSEIYHDISSPEKSFNSYLASFFLKNFSPIEEDYKISYGIDFSNHDGYSLLKYGIGQKFVNHIDDHKDFHRRISFVYYANDNYSGGEINFPRFQISYKPKANEMLVFPSNYVYNHSVSPVIEGTRYAVVSWIN